MHMKIQLTNEEKVLQVLNDKNKESKTNSVYIYKSDFSSLNMTEAEVTRSIYLLQSEGLLTISKSSPRNDLSTPWIISLNSAGVYYFDNKSKKHRSDKRDKIRTYIPILISLIALIKSFWPGIISALKLLMQLLK